MTEGRTNVDFDTLDHGEVFFRERKHALAEVVESQGVLPVEDRKSFFVDDSTGLENTDEYVGSLAVRSPFFIVEETIGLERAVRVNQKLFVDFLT